MDSMQADPMRSDPVRTTANAERQQAAASAEPPRPMPPAKPKASADLGLSKVSAKPLETTPEPAPPPPPIAEEPSREPIAAMAHRDAAASTSPAVDAPPLAREALPELSNLPPGIAESLARLAGSSRPSQQRPAPERRAGGRQEPGKG